MREKLALNRGTIIPQVSPSHKHTVLESSFCVVKCVEVAFKVCLLVVGRCGSQTSKDGGQKVRANLTVFTCFRVVTDMHHITYTEAKGGDAN